MTTVKFEEVHEHDDMFAIDIVMYDEDGDQHVSQVRIPYDEISCIVMSNPYWNDVCSGHFVFRVYTIHNDFVNLFVDNCANMRNQHVRFEPKFTYMGFQHKIITGDTIVYWHGHRATVSSYGDKHIKFSNPELSVSSCDVEQIDPGIQIANISYEDGIPYDMFISHI